jgi:hypothetical protein
VIDDTTSATRATTNDAAAGANPVALMTKAGHADMQTTKTYVHTRRARSSATRPTGWKRGCWATSPK